MSDNSSSTIPAEVLPHLGVYTRPAADSLFHLDWATFLEHLNLDPVISVTAHGGLSLEELNQLGQYRRLQPTDLPGFLTWLSSLGFRLTLPATHQDYEFKLNNIMADYRRRERIRYYADRHEISLTEATHLVDRVHGSMKRVGRIGSPSVLDTP